MELYTVLSSLREGVDQFRLSRLFTAFILKSEQSDQLLEVVGLYTKDGVLFKKIGELE